MCSVYSKTTTHIVSQWMKITPIFQHCALEVNVFQFLYRHFSISRMVASSLQNALLSFKEWIS